MPTCVIHIRAGATRRAAPTIAATVLLAPLLLAGGCAAGPTYRAPAVTVAVPASYTGSDATLPSTAPADRWWALLGDSLLDDLVSRALADNPDLAAAEARVRQARALARATGATLLPSLNASGRVGRDKLSRNGENLALIPFTPPTTEFTDYRAGLDVAWEIDFAGRTRREVEAAVARFGGQGETRNDARVVIAAEVATAYVDYRVACERLALARRTLATLEETLRLVRLQQQAGLISESDLRQAEAEHLASAGVPATLDAARDSARFRLAALTSVPASELAARLEPVVPIPATPMPTPIGMPSDLLRRRPDVRRAERDLAAATADVGSAVAAQFPRLSLVGDAGFDSVRSGDLTNAASRFWNVGAQLSVPLFSGGRLRRHVEAAEAAREAALANYRGTVLRAFADAESAVVRFAGDRGRAATLASAAATLAESLGLERKRYAAGDVSMLDVLAAERSANRAADQRAGSAGQLLVDFVALQKALGGGWLSVN
jgi:outer membrane protein, multidrug efflux system